MQKTADKLSGKSSDYADPMANVQGVDFELGTDVKTDDGSTNSVQDPTVNSNADKDNDGDKDDKGDNGDSEGGGGDDGGGTSTP
jgi:hypothetical protein